MDVLTNVYILVLYALLECLHNGTDFLTLLWVYIVNVRAKTVCRFCIVFAISHIKILYVSYMMNFHLVLPTCLTDRATHCAIIKLIPYYIEFLAICVGWEDAYLSWGQNMRAETRSCKRASSARITTLLYCTAPNPKKLVGGCNCFLCVESCNTHVYVIHMHWHTRTCICKLTGDI